MLSRILLVILVVVLTLPLAEGSEPAGAKQRAATVTKTFTSDGSISIPDRDIAMPYPSTITVSGLKRARISDVNVILSQFSHGTVADVDMVLLAPNRRNAMIMSDCGYIAAGITVRLDDSAPTVLPFYDSLSDGSFQPTNCATGDNDEFPYLDFSPSDQPSLRVFNGSDPNGEWRLYINDDETNQDGYIDRWALEITATITHKGKHRR